MYLFWVRRRLGRGGRLNPEAKHFAVARELGDELVVVDACHDVAHRLDAEAASVWRTCDGRTPVTEIAAVAGVAPERADHLLAELGERGLLVGDQTRRALLRRAVLAGAAVGTGGAIVSVLLPTPEAAFASVPGGEPAGSGPAGTQGEQVLGATDERPASEQSPAVTGSQNGSPRRPRSPGPRGTRGGRSVSPSGDGRRPGTAGAQRPVMVADARRGSTGATQRVDGGELPFTGSNALRTAAVGAGIATAGLAGHVALRRADPPPPPA